MSSGRGTLFVPLLCERNRVRRGSLQHPHLVGLGGRSCIEA